MSTDADLKAWCAARGINTIVHNGQLALTGDAMRQMADHAPDPVRAHAILDQLLAQARDEADK